MTRMQAPVLFLIAIGICVPASGGDAKPKQQTLHEIAESVQSNEQLYENMDVAMEMAYDAKLDPGQKAMPLPGGQRVVPFQSYRDKISHVSQNGLFRLTIQRNYSKVNIDKKEGESSPDFVDGTYERIRSYDGEKTRLLNGTSFGNVIHGRDDKDDTRVFPHMLLMRMSIYKSRLSTLLGGQIALETADEFDLGTKQVACTSLGEEQVEGENCAVIQVLETLKNGTQAVWRLSLATGKNYIPHRVECRQASYSAKLPTSIGKVTEWKEIQPGIWFPMRAEIIGFDKKELKKEMQAEKWKLAMTTESVSFDPKYGQEFFASVEFPEGISIYEIDNDRVGASAQGPQIVNTYVKGSPADPAVVAVDAAGKIWTTIVLVVGNALIALAVVMIYKVVSKRPRKLFG